nr:immunoglobulin light chain junction region [Macaca mulatta]MOX47489.1 immunoglobulin light chain junction region [Macaca mulatta]
DYYCQVYDSNIWIF